VSEEAQSPEEKNKSIDLEVLRQQADELRQSGFVRSETVPGGPARWMHVVYLCILVLVVAGALFLLISDQSRVRVLRGAGEVLARLASTDQDPDVFKLPPPPPKAVEPKIFYEGTPTFVFRAGGGAEQAGGDTGAPEGIPGTAPEADSPTPSPPEKTEGAKAAYDVLVQNSEVARKLSTNAIPDLEFKEWRPVRNNPPEFWINMVASRGGQNLEFVWSVDTESGTIRALSQNARDLERK